MENPEVTNNQLRAEQRKLMRRMQEASLGVLHGCEAPAPSLKMLRSRRRAGARLVKAAAALLGSIDAQLDEATGWRRCRIRIGEQK